MAGNQGLHSAENGKKGGRPVLQATKLREALYRKVEARADELSDVIIEKAIAGDIPAWKEIADRVFGRPAQAIDVTSLGESVKYTSEEKAAIASMFGGVSADLPSDVIPKVTDPNQYQDAESDGE